MMLKFSLTFVAFKFIERRMIELVYVVLRNRVEARQVDLKNAIYFTSPPHHASTGIMLGTFIHATPFFSSREEK